MRRNASSYVIEYMFRGFAAVGGLFPVMWPSKYGVRVKSHVRYKDGDHHGHTLDILYPAEPGGALRPVVLFVHGGGFMMLSKNTHRALALQFAKAGCVVFNINYRLAPAHPFPAPLADVADAWLYMLEHAEAYGGDPNLAIVTGESAGGNLVTSLALASVWRRPEEYAAKVFERGVVPIAAMPFCPMLSASRPQRFIERKPHLPRWLQKRIESVCRLYLQDIDHGDSILLADPLLAMQSEHAFERPLPRFFLPVGTRDPLLDDVRQFAAALQARGGSYDARYYEKGAHAFHGFLWQGLAQQCWADAIGFLGNELGTRGHALRQP